MGSLFRGESAGYDRDWMVGKPLASSLSVVPQAVYEALPRLAVGGELDRGAARMLAAQHPNGFSGPGGSPGMAHLDFPRLSEQLARIGLPVKMRSRLMVLRPNRGGD